MPTLEEARQTIQLILKRYNDEKGFRRKHALFRSSYSPVMQALYDWHERSRDLRELRLILQQQYEAYFENGNLVYGKRYPHGVDLSFICLAECDSTIFDGDICYQMLKDDIERDCKDPFDKNRLSVFFKKGLLHCLADKFLERLQGTRFFETKHADRSNTPVVWAIANGGFETAKVLIKIAPLDALMIKDAWGGKGVLTLLVAKGSAYKPDDKLVNIKEKTVQGVFDQFISRDDLNSDILNQTDNFGNTPLHIAFLRRDRHMIESLIKNGADMTLRNHEGLTPIELYQRITPLAAYNYINRKYFKGFASLGMFHDNLAARVPDDDLSDLIASYQKSSGPSW